MVRRGVTVVAGTDSGGNLSVLGFSLHNELASLNAAGMSSVQVLASATINPAVMMNSDAGVVEARRLANTQ